MNKKLLVTCNIAKKGLSGSPRLSPASAFLTWDMDAARNPFQAILRAVSTHFMKKLIILYILLLFFQSKNYSQSLITEDFSIDQLSRKEIIYIWKHLNRDSILNLDPIMFLRFLATDASTTDTVNMALWTLDSRIKGYWITAKDVDTLMNFIYSTQPSRPPYWDYSSYFPDNSTVGIEAMHLITVFKDTSFYYPSLDVTQFFCSPENQKEKADKYKLWWNSYKQQNK